MLVSSAIREPVPRVLATLAISSIRQSQKQHNEGSLVNSTEPKLSIKKVTQVSEEWLWKRHMLGAKHNDHAAKQQEER